MELTPVTFSIFMIVFITVGIIVAAATWQVLENGRHAHLIRSGVYVAIFLLFSVMALADWNDIGVATSLLHQRLFVVAVVIAAFVALVTHIARCFPGFRHRKAVAVLNAMSAGCVVGIAVGTTHWLGAAPASGYIVRVVLTVYVVLALMSAMSRRPLHGQRSGECGVTFETPAAR